MKEEVCTIGNSIHKCILEVAADLEKFHRISI